MGYWPSKIACFLNIVIMVGYGTIDCIIGGQILSAVSGGSMSIVVGIIIVALVSWIVAVFGLAVFHVYERYIILLIPDVGNYFNTDHSSLLDGHGSLSSSFFLFLSVLLAQISMLPFNPLETRLQ